MVHSAVGGESHIHLGRRLETLQPHCAQVCGHQRTERRMPAGDDPLCPEPGVGQGPGQWELWGVAPSAGMKVPRPPPAGWPNELQKVKWKGQGGP